MVEHLVLTLVVLICFYMATSVTGSAPIPDSGIKWCLYAIIAILAIVAILRIWGLAF